MIRPPKLPTRAAQAIVTAVALIAGSAIAALPAAASAGPALAHSQRQAQSERVRPALVSHPAAALLAGTGAAGTAAGALPLLNGDQAAAVRGPSGQPLLVIRSVLPGPGGQLLRIVAGGRDYVIPADALPYLGRGLDPRLFDVASLAAVASTAGGRLPVSLAFQGARPALPGITITSAGAGTASGYLTAASARTFGAALLRQFTADHGRASYGTDGLFAHGLSVALAGTRVSLGRARPSGSAAATPQFAMRTLTVHGTDEAGKPDTGDEVFVVNVDNSVRFGAGFSVITESANAFYHGTAKYSLPAGHYWAFSLFLDFNNPMSPAVRLVILPQFTVSAANTSVTVSERAANSRLSMKAPRPVGPSAVSVVIYRVGKAGPVTGVGATASGGFPVFVSPTSKRPTVGTLRTYDSGQLVSPTTAAQPYFYSIHLQGRSGLVGRQAITVGAASLATVTARYFADAPSTGMAAQVGVYPGEPALDIPMGPNMPVPVRRTEYFTAGNPRVTWFDWFFQDANTQDTGQFDSGRTFAAGSAVAEDWNRYPLHSVTNANAAGGRAPAPELVSASRAGNALTLDLSPFGDNTAGHNSAGYISVFDGSQSPTTGTYEVDENGTKIAAGNAVNSLGLTGGDLFTHVKLAPGSGTVTVTLDAARTGKLYTLATATHTVWSWHAAADPGTSVPAGWACDWSVTRNQGVPSGRRCAPQPLLTLNYQVAGLDLTGTAPAGAQTVAVHVGHMALASGAAVTGLTAQASFDDGTTWQPATVTGSGGSYQLAFTAPASGFVSLRVTATDAAGGSIDEAVTRAYATGAAAAALTAAVTPATSAAPGSGPRAACPVAPAGQVRCYTVLAPRPAADLALAAGKAAVPAGWSARNIESAYRLPAGRNPRQTVAVVDAFNSPNLVTDLAAYRKEWGLPGCGTAGGCLRIVNQRGRAKPLAPSGVGSGWDLETAADVEMISAACPHCRILVVEANSPTDADIAAAEDTAARLGAAVISNSFGERETGFSQLSAKHFQHPGHTIVASSGDSGFGAASFPANLTTVTAVGATQLSRASSRRGWSERAWNTTAESGGLPAATASGCSAYVAKPAWQHDGHCAGRTTADVAAVGWNIAIYAKTYGGWVLVGGTSLSAPIIAGVYALAGNATRIKPGSVYAHASRLWDITRGNNDIVADTGAACGQDYLCVAKPGYDAPTGLGSPDGTGAF